ncbi:MAG TPA: 3-oxoacyl-[acyl-carrier-protein] reductase [Lacipirellulaceae bacterium]|nr:3-oxoacyl-[acyl-carrier-protein] reductase [Lacipirellulaceae bacterium]
MPDTPNRRIQADLSGQVALVTGASRGIGRAIALTLARCGATVACVARNVAKLQAVADEIATAGGQASVHECDVVDSAAAQATVDAVVAAHGRLDVMVNNAGITKDTLLPIMSDEDWDQVIAANLRSVFLFTRAAAKVMMRQRSGRIINMSSVSGLVGNPGQSNYSASKAGIIGFTQTVARELAKRKVTVNAICPGFIATDMAEALGPAIIEEAKKRIPANRLGEADEIADAVLYLASDSGSYITGQVLTVDGGMTA